MTAKPAARQRTAAIRRLSIVSKTAGILGKRFPSGVRYERQIRREREKRLRRQESRSVVKRRVASQEYWFTVVIEADEAGYCAFCPELPGCYSQGKTLDEARRNIRDAVRLHVRTFLEDGLPVPDQPEVFISAVHVTVPAPRRR